MQTVQQTQFGDESNALEACLASLFNLKLSEVPQLSAHPDDEVPEVMEDRLYGFVRSRGFALYRVDDLEEFASQARLMGHYLVRGIVEINDEEGATGDEVEHWVIDRAGELAHDPHPGTRGLTQPVQVWLFVSRDPGP